MTDAAKTAKSPKPRKGSTVYQTLSGDPVSYKGMAKFYRDIIDYHNGCQPKDNYKVVQVADPNAPLGDRPLLPGQKSPVCAACGLDQGGCQNPYLSYVGSDHPVATILVESVSKAEDLKGELGAGGQIAYLAALIHRIKAEHGVELGDLRWVPITRCAWRREGKTINYKTKGNWCRYHVVQDLLLHPPKVVIPVGTAVLGLLSHKSNAQDWSGRLLTWRGWPDDWLTDPQYVSERPDPAHEGGVVRGHPVLGSPPTVRIPMVPLQSPRLIMSFQNPVLKDEWMDHLVRALRVGKESVCPLDYVRPWYRISTDWQEIVETLKRVTALAREHRPFTLAYDTETTGLKAWASFRRETTSVVVGNEAVRSTQVTTSANPRIVFMMFRWKHPQTGEPEAIGFPWDYPESELKPFLANIEPHVVELLSTADVTGHNLTFDELFTIATVGRTENDGQPLLADGTLNPAWLAFQRRTNRLCEAMGWDTWHMAFTLLQRRGSLGLEILAYDWVPDLAGYEEEMTLLIELNGDTMDPANEKGGHYANCPKPLWDTHLKPYVMGDVEVTYRAREAIAAELAKTGTYSIPLARPGSPGGFRHFECPPRDWVYKNILAPASRTLTKMMARGMFINPEELERQEQDYPEQVREKRDALRQVDAAIDDWCNTQAQETPGWELDLENKGQLKELLFKVLKLGIQRYTKGGRKLYGEDPAAWDKVPEEVRQTYAAVDKYTLNKLAVDHPNIRPLQEYRKVYKLYTTYIRPLRNMMAEHLDKKERAKDPHLAVDHCIHTSFMLAVARSGRLSSRDPNLQNLPLEGDVKRLFSSRFGARGCIYAADLSQIELRLMAAASGDPSMVNAYLHNVDLHSLTASKIAWGDGSISYEEFTKKHMEDLQRHGHADQAKKLELKRKIAKTCNFLTGYGGGAFGLQNVLANAQVYISLDECESIIESFFEAYPVLKRFLGVYKSFIDENACAVSIFGRVRHFDEIHSNDDEAKSKALRAGANHLIQSTASDIMLICLFTIEALMREANLNSLLVSTVHDSLVVDALREELPEVHDIVNGVTNSIPSVLEAMLPNFDTSWLTIPLAGDSEVGLNYLDTNKIGDDPDWEELLRPRPLGAKK